MSSRNAHRIRVRAAIPRGRLAERLFVGGCIGAYVVLIAAVIVALRVYGG